MCTGTRDGRTVSVFTKEGTLRCGSIKMFLREIVGVIYFVFYTSGFNGYQKGGRQRGTVPTQAPIRSCRGPPL